MLTHIFVGMVAASVSRVAVPVEVSAARMLVVTGLPALKASVSRGALYVAVGLTPLKASVSRGALYVAVGLPPLHAVASEGSVYLVTGPTFLGNQVSLSSTLYAVVTE